mgnify:FL=1
MYSDVSSSLPQKLVLTRVDYVVQISMIRCIYLDLAPCQPTPILRFSGGKLLLTSL